MAHYKHKALQNGDEHGRFVQLVREEKVRSYLEIGSYCGGSLWKVAMAMPVGGKLVSVDLPEDYANERLLRACCLDLRSRSFRVSLVLGDSSNPEIVREVSALAPFDLCFIDGAHGLASVRSDFENYGKMARVVAFHDINWRDRACAVPDFWDSVKSSYRHLEIKMDPRPDQNGIGVLWRSA